MLSLNDCCAGMPTKMETLTDTLVQTEKLIHVLEELVIAIDYKFNGPRLQPACCETNPVYQGIHEIANHNQDMLNDLAAQLSRIAERF